MPAGEAVTYRPFPARNSQNAVGGCRPRLDPAHNWLGRGRAVRRIKRPGGSWGRIGPAQSGFVENGEGAGWFFDPASTPNPRLPGLHLQLASGFAQRHVYRPTPIVLPSCLLDGAGLGLSQFTPTVSVSQLWSVV